MRELNREKMPGPLERLFAVTRVDTIKDLAPLIGVRPEGISKWIHRGQVPAARLREIAERNDYNLEWLETGAGPTHRWMIDAEPQTRAAALQALGNALTLGKLVAAPSEDEKALLDDYRACDSDGKRVVRKMAMALAQQSGVARAQRGAQVNPKQPSRRKK